MLAPLFYTLLLVAVTVYAYGRGHFDERLAATICVAGSLTTLALSKTGIDLYAGIEGSIFLIDVLALAAFILLALRSNRFWPLWVAGFQLTSVFSHLLKATHWSLIPQVYAAAERFWIYPIFLAIVVGTWRSRRRWRSEQPHRAQPA